MAAGSALPPEEFPDLHTEHGSPWAGDERWQAAVFFWVTSLPAPRVAGSPLV
jgi:hypothetical protein